jgi:hypothetical protein
MIGIALIATGIAQALFAFKSKSFGVGAARFGFSVLVALAGLSLVARPGAGLATITLLLAIWFVIDGRWFSGLNGYHSKPGQSRRRLRTRLERAGPKSRKTLLVHSKI